MEQRFNYAKVAPGGYRAMMGLEQYLHSCGLEEPLIHLIKLRTSQINGCAFCLDMHWKDLRAALAWTEAVTLVADGHVPDAVYDEVKPHFAEKELSDLTFAIAAINAWNRISIASRTTPGSYQPAPRGEKHT